MLVVAEAVLSAVGAMAQAAREEVATEAVDLAAEAADSVETEPTACPQEGCSEEAARGDLGAYWVVPVAIQEVEVEAESQAP